MAQDDSKRNTLSRPYTVIKQRVKGTLRRGRPQVTVTFPQYLFDLVRNEAEDQRRSFNAQLIVMLESVLDISEKR